MPYKSTGTAGKSASGASMSKYDVEVEARLQVIEETLVDLKEHSHETSGGLDPRVDKIVKWLEDNTSYYGHLLQSFIMRKFEFRPWGWYITLDEGVNYKIKKIHLNPNTKLSLQYHHHRDEHWTVVEGSGKAIVNKNVFIMNEGDDMFIAKKAVHRMEASPDGVTFVEVQRGKCDEEDIVRLQDDYGRVDKQP